MVVEGPAAVVAVVAVVDVEVGTRAPGHYS